MMRTSGATGRILESAGQAILILLLVLVAPGRLVPDARFIAVGLPTLLVLVATAYAFHAITFDAFRLSALRRRLADPLTRTVGH